MNRRNKGFTLLELLIVIAIIGFVLAGTTQMIVSTMTSSRQQSKIAETNIEGIIGLELLRQDLGKAGYGLPWNGLTAYQEAADNLYANSLNDSPNAPRGIVSVDNVPGANGILAGTDYLSIKAANVATNSACNKWILLAPDGTTTPPTVSGNAWFLQGGISDISANFAPTDQVIILAPGSPSSESTARTLESWGVPYSSAAGLVSAMTSTALVYGIDTSGSLWMPFNRADYYVKQPGTGMPQRCAQGTGILYKGVVSQVNGTLTPEMPLLDCVADMQVVYGYDPTGSGTLSYTSNSALIGTGPQAAQAIRDQVKEVRVYILAHEGQRDTTFTYPTNPVTLGADVGLGSAFDLSGIINWKNYRWKVYTLVVKLHNLQ